MMFFFPPHLYPIRILLLLPSDASPPPASSTRGGLLQADTPRMTDRQTQTEASQHTHAACLQIGPRGGFLWIYGNNSNSCKIHAQIATTGPSLNAALLRPFSPPPLLSTGGFFNASLSLSLSLSFPLRGQRSSQSFRSKRRGRPPSPQGLKRIACCVLRVRSQ